LTFPPKALRDPSDAASRQFVAYQPEMPPLSSASLPAFLAGHMPGRKA
jgi:hypothetical protein